MRAYLAMQAMESGKGLGGSYLGRTGLVPFGHGSMLLGEQGAQGKVCKSRPIPSTPRHPLVFPPSVFNITAPKVLCSNGNKCPDMLTDSSDSPPHLPLPEHRQVDPRRPEYDGPHCLLFS